MRQVFGWQFRLDDFGRKTFDETAFGAEQPHAEHTLVLMARDAEGTVRGVLHFVPCYGRSAVSLSFMRRDPATPNGLTEFMVATAAELLRERGLRELSLNFATFARWMHSPSRWHERVLGRVVERL